MASYSAIASTGLSIGSSIQRRTTVRFKFEVLPEKTTFIQAVCHSLPKDAVKCIQTMPGNNVDLTLRSESLVRSILQEGIKLNGDRVKPRPLGFRTTYVYVHYLPSELASEVLASALEPYGKVIEVRRQLYEGTSIETGTRIVNVEIQQAIPSFIHVGNYRARVWHKGQIQTCGFCGGQSHYKRDCPKLKALNHNAGEKDNTERREQTGGADKDAGQDCNKTVEVDNADNDKPEDNSDKNEGNTDMEQDINGAAEVDEGDSTDDSDKNNEYDEESSDESDEENTENNTNGTTNTNEVAVNLLKRLVDDKIPVKRTRSPSSPAKAKTKKKKKQKSTK